MNNGFPGIASKSATNEYPLEWIDHLLFRSSFIETCLERIRDDIRQTISPVETMVVPEDEHMRQVLNIVMGRFHRFISGDELPYEVSFRIAFYKHELSQKIAQLDFNESLGGVFNPLDEMLIYLNYNSKVFIRLLTEWITAKVAEKPDTVQRIDTMLYYYKAFRQLHPKPTMRLNPKYHDLTDVLEGWFTTEINYLERRLELNVVDDHAMLSPASPQAAAAVKVKPPKVRCMLSSDQLALIFRAADESRVLVAKSLSAVFNQIVPFLSTPHRDDLSPSSVRSRSYAAEQTDKEAAIEALERIIKRIKEY